MKYLSEKIKWFYLMAAIGVVVIHCPLAPDALSRIVVRGFVLWCVPFFFVASGYLFLGSLQRYDWKTLMQRKLFSLVMPYLLWCFLRLVLSAKFHLLNQPLEAFGFTCAHPLGNMTLWFLRLLIILDFIVATGYYIFKRSWMLASVMAVAFFGGAVYLHLESITGTPSSPFYFLIGFILRGLAENRKWPLICESRIGFHRVFCWTFVVLFVGCSYVLGLQYEKLNGLFKNALFSLQIVTLWIMFDFLCKKTGQWCPAAPKCCGGGTFFLFCVHGMILDGLKSIWTTAFGMGTVSTGIGFVIFICMVPVTILMLAQILESRIPRFYRIMTGGRI